jgi:thiamine-phosphate diphosphorylase
VYGWVIASPEQRRVGIPRLHVVTDDEVLSRAGWRGAAREILDSGGPGIALHLRGSNISGARLHDQASACAEIARRTGSWILVNDRLDIALATGAAGVQLGGSSFSAREVRSLADDLRIGVSVHDAEQAEIAGREGADWVLAGTLFRSASHPEWPGKGTAWLAELAALGTPVIGIGGIDVPRVAEVRAAGAYGVAVIRAVWDAPSPAAAVTDLLAELGSLK